MADTCHKTESTLMQIIHAAQMGRKLSLRIIQQAGAEGIDAGAVYSFHKKSHLRSGDR